MAKPNGDPSRGTAELDELDDESGSVNQDGTDGVDGGDGQPSGDDEYKFRTKTSKYKTVEELHRGKIEADDFIENTARPAIKELERIKEENAFLKGQMSAHQGNQRGQQDQRPQVNPELERDYRDSLQDFIDLGYDEAEAKKLARREALRSNQQRENIRREVAETVSESVGTTRQQILMGQYNAIRNQHPEFDYAKNPLAKAAYDEDPSLTPDQHFDVFKRKYKQVHGVEFGSDDDDGTVYRHEANGQDDEMSNRSPRTRHFARSSAGSSPPRRPTQTAPEPKFVRDSVELHKRLHPEADAQELKEVREQARSIHKRRSGGYNDE